MSRMEPRSSRLKVNGDIISYDAQGTTSVGCIIMPPSFSSAHDNYFEIKIIDSGVAGCISIGLAHYDYPLDCQPGWKSGSVAYHADDGRLYKASGRGRSFGPRCKSGDRIGCGIRASRKDPMPSFPLGFAPVKVYFTKNGEEIGSTNIHLSPDSVRGFYPAIGMHSKGETVEITVRPDKEVGLSASDDFMMVDDGDDDWIKAHDVRINGQIIEYTGNGEHIHDVGLAQAKSPLTTTNHYFEIEILEPGQRCYIAIGLVHKHYPLRRHPGWNVGSIAYHADDGKIFVGRGQGTPFGPRCYRGDVMGCGIQYPVEYVTPSDDEDDEEDIDQKPGEGDGQGYMGINLVSDFLDDLDHIDMLNDDLGGSGDEDELLGLGYANPRLDDVPWAPKALDGEDHVPMDFVLDPDLGRRFMERWIGGHRDRGMNQGRMFLRGRGGINGREQPAAIYGHKDGGMMVKVFFTKNGSRIGQKEVMMPKGGFFPAIGMLSTNEKIKVDFRPLSG